MERKLSIMTHGVYLNIKQNGFHLSEMAGGKHISPLEAGLTIENGGFLWLAKIVEDTQNNIVRSSQLWFNE
jgi:hypothetical protein